MKSTVEKITAEETLSMPQNPELLCLCLNYDSLNTLKIKFVSGTPSPFYMLIVWHTDVYILKI